MVNACNRRSLAPCWLRFLTPDTSCCSTLLTPSARHSAISSSIFSKQERKTNRTATLIRVAVLFVLRSCLLTTPTKPSSYVYLHAFLRWLQYAGLLPT